jgi:hypothetical protein
LREAPAYACMHTEKVKRGRLLGGGSVHTYVRLKLKQGNLSRVSVYVQPVLNVVKIGVVVAVIDGAVLRWRRPARCGAFPPNI